MTLVEHRMTLLLDGLYLLLWEKQFHGMRIDQEAGGGAPGYQYSKPYADHRVFWWDTRAGNSFSHNKSPTTHFKMERTLSLRDVLKKEGYMIKVDIQCKLCPHGLSDSSANTRSPLPGWRVPLTCHLCDWDRLWQCDYRLTAGYAGYSTGMHTCCTSKALGGKLSAKGW